MKKKLTVLCNNLGFQRRFLAYLRKEWQDSFTIWEAEEGEILITDLERDFSSFQDVYHLSEELSEDNNLLYRYQSGCKIVQELLFKAGKPILPKGRARKSSLVLFYTPGGHSGQSDMARNYARRLGKMEKALYVYYGPFMTLGDGEGMDLSTLCYEIYTKGAESITPEKISAALCEAEELKYLEGFHNPLHMARLKGEFVSFMERLMELSMFDSIVLDLGELPFDVGKILAMTTELYSILPRQELREEYETRMHKWRDFMKTLEMNCVNLMVKEREYQCGTKIIPNDEKRSDQ
ncbi:MAG: hypothetical protein K6A30_08975 [Lachnospiraceae bacterium]|nr:hypothetical protein [Lachnospiraceae bacterium]